MQKNIVNYSSDNSNYSNSAQQCSCGCSSKKCVYCDLSYNCNCDDSTEQCSCKDTDPECQCCCTKEKCNCRCNSDDAPACLDPRVTVIAQYANSPTMLHLIDCWGENISVCRFFKDFYRYIWHIDCASGYGLDIWGVIVGINRTVKTFTGFFWGFNEETLLLARPYHDYTGYNDKGYYDENKVLINPEDARTAIGTFRDFQELESEITFSDTNLRKLILAKAYANISNYTASDLNKILMMLFGREANDEKGIKAHIVYVQDNFDMSMTIVFNWILSSDEVAVLLNAGILFKPAGVELKVDFQLKL